MTYVWNTNTEHNVWCVFGEGERNSHLGRARGRYPRFSQPLCQSLLCTIFIGTIQNDLQSLQQIKDIIYNRSVRARFLLTAVIGLPDSDSSSVLMDLLGRSERIKNTNGMDMYHGLLFKDMVTGKSHLKDVTDTDDKNYQMLLLTLAKFLVTKHYKLQIVDDWRKWKKEKPTENFFQSCVNPFAGDHELSKYFEEFCEKLFKMMEAIENPNEPIPTMATTSEPDPEKPGEPTSEKSGEPEPSSSAGLSSSEMKMILTQSHTFINFFDISLNKAANEVVFLLGSTYESVILLNCLNLSYYTEEMLKKPVEISDESMDSEDKAHLYGLHKAYQYFVHHVVGTFAFHRKSEAAILVGTHHEECSDLEKRRSEVSDVVTNYAHLVDIDGALAFNGEIILSKDLSDSYLELLDRGKKFEEYVPMKFIFLRCFLHSTNKLFMTYEELTECATKCGLSSSEIEEFLALFRKFCSLFHLETKGEGPSYVVLQPTKFVKGLDSLYSSRASLPMADRLVLNNGLLSEKKARDIWLGPGNESITRYEFYTSILMTFGLMTQVPDYFFLPSLRLDYSRDKPSTESNSMIILYNMALIPFHKLCAFVDVFTKERSDKTGINIRFLPCADYNVAKFECVKADKVIAVASIRFRSEYLELFVTGVSNSHPEIYSILKTACVKVLIAMCTEFEALRFKLAIVCPKSKDPLHFAEFDPTVPSKRLTCDEPTCDHQLDTSAHPAGQWVLSGYTEHPKTAIHPKGI